MNKSGSSDGKRYDRQLRLWGDHGQYALEHSKVCLVGAGPTGSEVLKNLVLPAKSPGRKGSAVRTKRKCVRKFPRSASVELLKSLRQREPELEASFSLDNFTEASKAVNIAVIPTEIPSEVKRILSDDRLDTLLPPSYPEITRNDVQLFVKNAAFIRVIQGQTFTDLIQQAPTILDCDPECDTDDDDDDPVKDAMSWFLVLRAASGFLDEQGRLPGASPLHKPKSSSDYECSKPLKMSKLGDALDSVAPAAFAYQSDIKLLRRHLDDSLTTFNMVPTTVKNAYVEELVRFGGQEVHSVAALLGGVVSQEVIKLILHQFVPTAKPIIYNAITQRMTYLEF